MNIICTSLILWKSVAVYGYSLREGCLSYDKQFKIQTFNAFLSKSTDRIMRPDNCTEIKKYYR